MIVSRMWEMYIMDSFAQREGKQTEYLLYRSEQVGRIIS